MAYTSAPWRVGDAGYAVFGPPNGNPSPETVATVKNPDNARLIAAAPALLAALMQLREAFYVKGTRKAIQAAFDATHPLIAKVKGV